MLLFSPLSIYLIIYTKESLFILHQHYTKIAVLQLYPSFPFFCNFCKSSIKILKKKQSNFIHRWGAQRMWQTYPSSASPLTDWGPVICSTSETIVSDYEQDPPTEGDQPIARYLIYLRRRSTDQRKTKSRVRTQGTRFPSIRGHTDLQH
jgi:hypothetical protein